MTQSPTNPESCSRCGASLPPNAPEGLCPRCVMELNVLAETEFRTGEEGPHGTRVVKTGVPPLPPEEVARLFPQLEILSCLGRGGMGAVYKARQPRLDRFVALKILSPEKHGDRKFADRFEREARTLARLHHPNIVTVYEFGEIDGRFYLLMEFVDGLTLRELIQTRRLRPEEAFSIVPNICDALQYAHRLGVVHRDIKPENILLDKTGQVKIADFGIAKLVGQESPAGLTQEKQVIGTPHYMAPEQVEKPGEVDHRADIYSLGVVFYEILTGELPLGKFPPPSEKVEVDVRLDEVVLRTLEKEPKRRYQHASEVKTDVQSIASGVPPRMSHSNPPAHSKSRLSRILIPLGVAVAALAAFFVIAVGLLVFYRGSREHRFVTTTQFPISVPTEITQSSSNGSSIVVGSDEVLHYAVYYPGTFDSSGGIQSNRRSLQWYDDRNIRLPNGRTFAVVRESAQDQFIRINGREYYLKEGRVFVLDDNGTAEQLTMDVTLAGARSLPDLGRAIESIRALPAVALETPVRSETASARTTDSGEHANPGSHVEAPLSTGNPTQEREESRSPSATAVRPPVETAPNRDSIFTDLAARARAAGGIESFSERDAALKAIANDAARAGHIQLLDDIVSKITSFTVRDQVIRGTAPKVASTDCVGALSLIRKMSSFAERDKALSELAIEAARQRQIGIARSAVSAISSFTARDETIHSVVRELQKGGLRSEAIDFARLITSWMKRDAVIRELSE